MPADANRPMMAGGAALCDRLLFRSERLQLPPGDPEDDTDENSSMLNLLCVWSYGFLTAVEGKSSLQLWPLCQVQRIRVSQQPEYVPALTAGKPLRDKC